MTISIIFLVLVSFIAYSSSVQADQVNSVKDCLDNPAECGDEEVTSEGDANEKRDSENGSVGVTIWDFVKMILATIFVMALIYYLLKFLGKRNKGYQNTALVQNIGGTRVGANRSVQIIKVGDQVFLVGVGENVNLLKEFEDENSRKLLRDYNNRLEQLTEPGDIFSKLLQRRTKKPTNENGESFSRALNKQFEDITKRRKQAYEEIKKEGPRNDE